MVMYMTAETVMMDWPGYDTQRGDNRPIVKVR